MRVLFLNYEFPPLGGGAANATFYLFKELSKFPNVKVDLITSSIDRFRVEKFSDRISIHYLDIHKKGSKHYQSNLQLIRYSIKALRYSKKLIKENGYDLVHAFFGIPGGYIAMRLGLPYIVSLRGSDVPGYNPRFKILDHLLFRRMSFKIWKRSTAVIANSEGLKKLALKTSPEQCIDVIYNGVETSEFRVLDCEPFSKEINLVSTGRLIKRKGYHLLIEALAGLKDIRLDLIGDGNQKEELQALAAQHKVNVVFHGAKAHHELPDLLNRADIFVLPSMNEGMSNSVLEAMACGLPVLATDVGGSRELIDGNGKIIKEITVKEIRKSLEWIAKQDLKKMGHRSRQLAEKMSWKNVANSYYEIYQKILNESCAL